MGDISPVTFEVAQNFGHEFFQLAITQWGNVSPINPDNLGSTGYLLPYGICGAEVHPRSEIEGFRIRWTRPFPEQPTQIVPPDTIRVQDYFVMRDKPFIGRLPGPVTIIPLPQDYYADAYISIAPAGTPVFGSSMVAPTVFDPPELWANFYIRNEPRLSGARHHYRIGPITNDLTGFGTIDTVCALPMSGRKNIRIILNSTTITGSPGSVARAVNVKISGLAGNNTGVGIGLDNRLQEYEIQSVHVPANSYIGVPITGPHQWLLIKAEVEDSTAGALRWRVDASDYP